MKPLLSLALTFGSAATALAGWDQPLWLRVILVGLGAVGVAIGLAMVQLTIGAILRAAQRGIYLLGDGIGAVASMADDIGEEFVARLAAERAGREGLAKHETPAGPYLYQE